MPFRNLFHKNIDRNNRSENEETSNRNDGFSLRRNIKRKPSAGMRLETVLMWLSVNLRWKPASTSCSRFYCN